MAELFNQNDFSGGLVTDLDTAKLPPTSYSLLVNGRTRENVVKPVLESINLEGPDGNYQNLVIAGTHLVLIVSGELWHKNISTNGPWLKISGWNNLDKTKEFIYAEIVPASTNTFNRKTVLENDVDVEAVVKSFNSNIRSTPQALLVTDGVNQPRLVSPSFSFRLAKTFDEWTRDDPEYVPIGTHPVLSGQKEYMLSPDGLRIYQSVSGRPLDFMVNIKSDGTAGGDAETTSIAVDYNPISALFPLQDGGLLAGTKSACHQVWLDNDNTIFAEPILRSRPLFPVGIVNQFSFADVLGDTAFVSSAGPHAFNVTAQTQRESNNFPLGSPIKRLVSLPVTRSAAVNYDDYALFALNTPFGPGVFIYDTIRKTFSAIDTHFGSVKKFTIYLRDGRWRLFFITFDNVVYEAFIGSRTLPVRVFLGEFSSGKANTVHVVTDIYATFTNIKSDTDIQTTYFGDGKQISTVSHQVKGISTYRPSLPYVADHGVKELQAGSGKLPTVWKSGVLIEWKGDSDLAVLTVEGTASTASDSITPDSNAVERFSYIADTGANKIQDAVEMAYIDLASNKIYFIHGTATTGGKCYSDTVFRLRESLTVSFQGSLYDITALRSVVNLMEASKLSAVIGGGDHAYPSGSQQDVEVIKGTLADIWDIFFPTSGNRDVDTEFGHFWYAERAIELVRSFVNVDFFYVPAFYQSSGVSVDGDGNPVGPQIVDWEPENLQEALRVSTKSFKVVIVHFPPYTDSANYYPGYAPLRLPYKEWGANLVLSGHSHVYERFEIDGLTYIVCGLGGRSRYLFEDGVNRSKIRFNDLEAYLTLNVTRFSLQVKAIDAAKRLRDSLIITS